MNKSIQLSLIPYDARCLELSWYWLNDPEIRALTRVPVFSREDQNAFFNSLPYRSDYLIWGVALDSDNIIGAAGLKNHRGHIAEYWCYIGEKQYWNKGIGCILFYAVELKAKGLNFTDLEVIVAPENKRSILAHKKVGFVIDWESSTEASLRMVKKGI